MKVYRYTYCTTKTELNARVYNSSKANMKDNTVFLDKKYCKNMIWNMTNKSKKEWKKIHYI